MRAASVVRLVPAGAAATLVLCGAAALFGAAAAVHAAAQPAANPQAVEGKKRYAEKCARCHGPEADGIEHAPALKGDVFRAEWNGKAARELYKRIISTMPQDDPGSLPEPDVVQITTFLVSLNNASIPAVQHANDLNAIKLDLGTH